MSEGGSYFTAEKDLEFISSGCTLLDCVLGGGWPLGRVSNIIGDSSTGKTLLAIEACANFARKFTKGKIFYREAEAAFDLGYAEALGMPVDRVDFPDDDFFTVNDFYDDIDHQLKYLQKVDEPALYILDSLDALADKGEMEEAFDKGSYGAGKAKDMSKLFRQIIRRVENSRMHLMIISQTRDKIGVMFGTKYSVSGGRALQFYATHRLYLAHIETLQRVISKIKRPDGIRIKAKCIKNKIGLPLRECEFDIKFGYGVDDLGASLDWLKEVDLPHSFEEKVINKLSDAEYFAKVDEVAAFVKTKWREIDTSFLPQRRKY